MKFQSFWKHFVFGCNFTNLKLVTCNESFVEQEN